ncbi:GxxExxY protein [Phormidium sp. LEGE 05292]|uniref:GxxExxY protein n=2 Tax=Floridanema TaxID=3396149 RepID=A0ABV4X5V7_9CYAN|nr:GxxExxY protein [Phormidium sp. LEGE 05292]MBE9229434.1 GxxExxY protein [Phormidium sp. LEGE 05292]
MRQPSQEVEQLAYAVIGAAIEVHRLLGPGFLEAVYEEALAVEFDLRGIPFKRQVVFAVHYKGQEVGEGRLDFLVGNNLIVELKALENVPPIQQARVISYLKATKHPLALLINFNVQILKDGIKRIVLSS